MENHQEKQRIFDEYAQSKLYHSWEMLVKNNNNSVVGTKDLMKHIFAACDLVQEEQQKKIVDKAKMIVKTEHGESEAVAFGVGERSAWIDENSIINPENKIQ